MSKAIPFKIECDLIEMINKRIRWYRDEGSYDLDDDPDSHEIISKEVYRAQASALEGLRDELVDKINVSSIIGQIKTP